MEEVITLKQLLHEGKLAETLEIVEELEEMSKSDKVNKIFSYSIILLLNLIEQSAKNRNNKSWETSILNSVKQIQRTNKRYKASGTYLTREELGETLEDAYELGLRRAALEAFEGSYEVQELDELVDKSKIIQKAIDLITA